MCQPPGRGAPSLVYNRPRDRTRAGPALKGGSRTAGAGSPLKRAEEGRFFSPVHGASRAAVPDPGFTPGPPSAEAVMLRWIAGVIVAALVLSGAVGADEKAPADRPLGAWVADLKATDAATRKAACQALGRIGAAAKAAVPDLA